MWRKVQQEYLGPQYASHAPGSGRTLYIDSQSPTTQEKPDNGKERRTWNQMPPIILSPPLAHFLPFKPHIHNINSVGKEVKEYVSCRQNNWLTPFFIFQSIALLSDTASVQSFSSRGKVPFQQFMLLLFSLFSPPHTDSPLAKRNIQSANIDSKDYAIYILMQTNTSHCNALGNCLSRPIFVFCFQFNSISPLWF